MKKILIPLLLPLLISCQNTKISTNYITINLQDTIILDTYHYHYNNFENVPTCIELPGDTVVFKNQFTIQKCLSK